MLLIGCLVLGACADPDTDWALAARDDTAETYLEFLARYPGAQQADLARVRIQELKVIRTWEHAKNKASQSAYRDFIDKHPGSEYAAEAQTRIVVMERDERWAFVDESNDKTLLTGFIRSYPDAPQRAQAEAQLAEIMLAEEAAKPQERPGAFRLQLASFRTVVSAETELRRLVAMFPDTLLGPVYIEMPGTSESRKLFRLKTVPMTGTEARTICTELRARRQECMLVNR